MAGFDPDVFGGTATAQGFDADVFSAPEVKPVTTLAPKPTQPAGPVRDKFDLRGSGYDAAMNYSPRNAIGGAVSGAGSIGASLLRPFESGQANQERRTGIDEALTSLVGSDPNSTAFKANKLGVQFAGTAGAGGAIAKGLSLIPGAARALPTLLPAIESGGMTANGATGAYGMASRVAGGAVNGAATAGLVNPDQTGTGALIGAATPPAVKLGQMAGRAIGGAFNSPPINPTLQQTARESVDAGYVIPPNMVAPNLKSQVLESISGKQATQQIASTKNNEVTENLVRGALGIPAGTPLSQSTLENLRRTAGKAYADVSSLSPQAASDLEALKVARNESQAWFKAYNRSASPIDLAKAKQLGTEAQQLETALESHAQAANRPDLIPALRQARKDIAKTYTVGRALNDAAGTVDARVLGRMYEKGIPLSDGLDVAGKFASAFPTISKSTQQVGSPAAHNLKSFGSLLLGSGGYAAMGPAGLATAAVPFVAPPLARAAMFSNSAQRAMVNPNGGGGLLGPAIDQALPLLYRSGGLLATSGR